MPLPPLVTLSAAKGLARGAACGGRLDHASDRQWHYECPNHYDCRESRKYDQGKEGGTLAMSNWTLLYRAPQCRGSFLTAREGLPASHAPASALCKLLCARSSTNSRCPWMKLSGLSSVEVLVPAGYDGIDTSLAQSAAILQPLPLLTGVP